MMMVQSDRDAADAHETRESAAKEAGDRIERGEANDTDAPDPDTDPVTLRPR